MRILAIETSCDETGIAILETKGVFDAQDGTAEIKVLADIILSQAQLHAEFGGVFPALARREHAKNILPIIVAALKSAGLHDVLQQPRVTTTEETQKLSEILAKEPDLLLEFFATILSLRTPAIDAIAVTSGPGLEPALWVGINTAQALGFLWNVPVIPVNHMEGHIMASLLVTQKEQDGKKVFTLSVPRYPALALLISGGHTELVLMPSPDTYQILGQTRDDAVGEAFDKVARILGLGYPGGPEISKLAETAPHAEKPPYPLPRPMLHSKDYDFSFSGLKTAVLYTVKKISPHELTNSVKASIAKEFEDSATEVLLTKTLAATEEYGVREIILGGGVSANKKIRAAFREAITEKFPDTTLFIPDHALSTDNGLMIGIAGLLRASKNNGAPSTNIRAQGTMRL
ncbi:MAG: tRNA (adenosine(37)-N6)-threonylcarbamoyltransferase complex transferase subunit TsaD [Patescibacteria group bacterium]